MMRTVELFSAAAGGWSLGLHRAGFVTVAACEIVEWRRILYSENFPHVRLYPEAIGRAILRTEIALNAVYSAYALSISDAEPDLSEVPPDSDDDGHGDEP